MSWFQALTFPRGVTQFFGVSRGEALFCLESLGVKDLKILGVLSKKYVLDPPCLASFWNTPLVILYSVYQFNTRIIMCNSAIKALTIGK